MITRWDELTWEDIEGRDRVVPVVVTGSVEQHGKHLPVGTDVMIPLGLVDRLGARYKERSVVGDLVLLPPVSYTYARHSNWLAGTVNLGGQTLIMFTADMLKDVFRQGLQKLVIVNGHLESLGFISEGIRVAEEQYPDAKVLFINWWELVSEQLIADIFGDNWPGWEAEHAALTETSLMMALRPDLVKMERAEFDPEFAHYPYMVLPEPSAVRPPTGSYADMGAATKETGERLADHIVDGMVAALEQQYR